MELSNIPRKVWTRLSLAIAALIWILAAGFAVPVATYIGYFLDQAFISQVLYQSFHWMTIILWLATVFVAWDGYGKFALPGSFDRKRTAWAVAQTVFALWYFSTAIALNNGARMVTELCFN